ncbi:MAG TPA: hypothetical protein DCF92_12940 [Idiomarina sp.]|nr:hypothetical protein [Idiomarina sp.]
MLALMIVGTGLMQTIPLLGVICIGLGLLCFGMGSKRWREEQEAMFFGIGLLGALLMLLEGIFSKLF